LENINSNRIVEDVLHGSFDLHVHSGPDDKSKLRLGPLETARYAQEFQMKGFVLKSHHYSTAPIAMMLNDIYPDLTVISSITLNDEVGGINPKAVQSAADMGAKVVWFPADIPFGQNHPLLTDELGKLTNPVLEILEIVKSRDLLISSGHINFNDSRLLFKTAKDMKIEKMLLSHPLSFIELDQQLELVNLGVKIEFAFLACTPSRTLATVKDFSQMIRKVGIHSCVLTTDFGQWLNPVPAEGMRMAIAELLNVGMKPEELISLTRENPINLVGI
tara:strand:- start:40304 stop:41128 length:825 start_codon:yes stop_codon:yes gene_type:complete